jgi:hypothetical protein
MYLIIEKVVGTLFNFLPYLIAFSIISYVVKSRPGLFNDLTPTRERTQAEKILSWSGLLVMLVILVELYLTNNDLFTASEAYWLNILPLLWLTLTVYRKDIPGDRTATNVGIWTLAPYAAYALSPQEMPGSTWLSLCLFGAAFVIGIWREIRSDKP